MIDVKFMSSRAELESEFTKAMMTAAEKIGLRAERHAKAYCPVDTGRLRNSISHAVNYFDAYIGTNVEYAPYVELGTSKRKAHPYLKPAVENHISEYRDIVDDALKS